MMTFRGVDGDVFTEGEEMGYRACVSADAPVDGNMASRAYEVSGTRTVLLFWKKGPAW